MLVSKLCAAVNTQIMIMPPLTFRPTFIHAPTQHIMIHCASRVFGTETCGEALIKSVSAQPQVKCLHPTSISLAHLCHLAAGLTVPHYQNRVYCAKIMKKQNNNSNSSLVCHWWGRNFPKHTVLRCQVKCFWKKLIEMWWLTCGDGECEREKIKWCRFWSWNRIKWKFWRNLRGHNVKDKWRI